MITFSCIIGKLKVKMDTRFTNHVQKKHAIFSYIIILFTLMLIHFIVMITGTISLQAMSLIRSILIHFSF